MFFVPGGRFEQGAAGTWLYWGEIVANTSLVIIVTTNYRLGALGFLASETIPGNYGLEDQRMALAWTRDNIAAFGGDPNAVTLFGQSAGGTSTAVHLTSKASQGLFQKAIIHSNPFTLPMKDPKTAALNSRDFALALKCQPNDLACMRSKTTDEIIKASNVANDQLNISDPVTMFYPWTPVVDGVRCDGQPLDLFRSGNFTKMPIIVGNVEEEALLFIWEVLPNGPASAKDYQGIVEWVFGPNAPTVLATYPPYPTIPTFDYRYLMQLMGTDWIFTCPNRYIATGIAKYNGGQPFYMYRFNHALSFDAWGPNYTECVGHVCHGSELVYLFQSETQGNSGFLFTDQEQLMANSITAAWTNFAHTSNPNTPPSELSHRLKSPSAVDITWPLWTPDTDLRITYSSPSSEIVPNWRGTYCDIWDKVGYLDPK
jgi:acetylcholinesterase/cholinesterase